MLLEETKASIGNRLVQDYLSSFDLVQDFFVHAPYQDAAWKERREWLFEHPLSHREQLVEGLRNYNQSLQNHEAAMLNIEKLKEVETYVVIGGQQPGVLTGPLYVIYKAVTLIKLAQKHQAETGKPVIPVFWIASEDHDYEEVNHVYVQAWERAIEKLQLDYRPKAKTSISQLPVGSDSLQNMTSEYFSRLPDSVYHKQLKSQLLHVAGSASSLNEFFAKIMAWLFGEYGLVLVDSADAWVRKLEKPIFASFIEKDMSKELMSVQENLLKQGYHSQLDIQKENAHFFIYESGQRQLLIRKGQEFQAKGGGRLYRSEELLKRLEDDPCSFSANVVSRPIMQEWLFPVLAFVGGPGEISYWAQLKPVFEHMNMQMPIVFPRMSFTLIERDISKYMESFQLNLEDVYERWEELRRNWIMEQTATDLSARFQELKTSLQSAYLPFLDQITQVEPGVKKLGEANWTKILSHLDFLERKTEEAIEIRHHAGLKHWDDIQASLYPMEKPQERVYNIFGYLNKYGYSFIKDLISQPLELQPKHMIVYI
ncbi:bacillithiol biosynthesis cysteine-adding enzyme BshC [Ammoniphilus sp. CFH 90114]|uniref:bacillithiol biosynthesis cysteine-adding enzyme BshC n=1 Tax=Ammoniphilus sp. CFH 90114 TaxID=2493665 RepID=UPI0013E94620|nr:bacillithiol biosynthesis cysteine-adding enzyme BshC [Ammoniphilus sp. CFH 90114]